MIEKHDFLERHEDLITEEFCFSVSKLAPKLESEGYFKEQLQYSCVPGVVIEVQRRLQKHLYDHGWMAEIGFSVGTSGPLLDIKVY